MNKIVKTEAYEVDVAELEICIDAIKETQKRILAQQAQILKRIEAIELSLGGIRN